MTDRTDERAEQLAISLRPLLAAVGVTEKEIDAAAADGTLPWLAVERLVLPELPKYSVADLAREGEDVSHQRAFRRALGFPDVPLDEKIYNDTDLEMLRMIGTILEADVIDYDVALQMTRIIGSSVARIASAQVDAIEVGINEHLENDDTETLEAETGPFLVGTGELINVMPAVMEWAWRRHMVAAARRKMLKATGVEGDQTVGFADLVGFTALSQQVDEPTLAEVVGRFEQLAYDTVAEMGGRVVKMIGDEVMFAVEGQRAGVDLALRLAEVYGQDEALGDVRVGLASGAVLEKDGDLYGPVVNLASRVVEVAYPGSVVVSEELADAVRDLPGYRIRSLRPHRLRGVGRVPLYSIRRVAVPGAADEPEAATRSTLERARDHRQALREWILGHEPEQGSDGAG